MLYLDGNLDRRSCGTFCAASAYHSPEASSARGTTAVRELPGRALVHVIQPLEYTRSVYLRQSSNLKIEYIFHNSDSSKIERI